MKRYKIQTQILCSSSKLITFSTTTSVRKRVNSEQTSLFLNQTSSNVKEILQTSIDWWNRNEEKTLYAFHASDLFKS